MNREDEYRGKSGVENGEWSVESVVESEEESGIKSGVQKGLESARKELIVECRRMESGGWLADGMEGGD